MIPEITRPEWNDLITGKLNVNITSFSLQMKLNTLKKLYSSSAISLTDAAKDLHELCTKYERIYASDLKTIFK